MRDEAEKMKDAYRLDMQGVDTSYTERVKEKARATKVVGYYYDIRRSTWARDCARRAQRSMT